jgi:hypothetical protein
MLRRRRGTLSILLDFLGIPVSESPQTIAGCLVASSPLVFSLPDRLAFRRHRFDKHGPTSFWSLNVRRGTEYKSCYVLRLLAQITSQAREVVLVFDALSVVEMEGVYWDGMARILERNFSGLKYTRPPLWQCWGNASSGCAKVTSRDNEPEGHSYMPKDVLATRFLYPGHCCIKFRCIVSSRRYHCIAT